MLAGYIYHLVFFPPSHLHVNKVMVTMSIEWDRLEHEPHKEVKILAKVLLDFRKKLLDQDAEIIRLRDELDRLKQENTELSSRAYDIKASGSRLRHAR
nr:hypothetical protein [Candidatus Sigynarchaeota archaeon]